ncbi:MAG: hypothetical protein KKI08_03790 [Armatimonadetes bacterium]|nr:hypothetical protein [Armatimonadota bacterium]
MRVVRLLVVVTCGLGLLALAGCGCGKVREVAEAVKMANDARDGKMTVTNEKGEKATIESKPEGDNAGSTTVTTAEGTTTSEYGKNKVTEEQVGIIFYPDAEVDQSAKATSTEGEGTATWSSVSLLTTDPFENVANFYKDRYSEGNTVVEQPDSLLITINSGPNSGKIIMVAFDADVNKIRINIQAGGKQ